MNVPQQLATYFRAVHFGGNWTSVNLKTVLSDITWEEANIKLYDLNTILALSFHISYYVTGVLEVFNNRPLLIRDKYSYDHPDVTNAKDWDAMKNSIFINAETLAQHIEAIPEAKIWDHFEDAKYGTYFSNVNGIIEHTHYHLGQITLIKKIIRIKT
ncbi:MAG: DUF1572 domain-containing protein [Psychroserpens sp.]|uniref:DUF1572 domain-containing protein n=1 Tax=Psychroserpens sp. TaxID=2020870 RepID=UPI003C71ADB4